MFEKQLNSTVQHFKEISESELILLNEDRDLLSYLKNEFYRCNFVKVISKIDSKVENLDDTGEVYKYIMLKSKCLYELNRREEAKILLKSYLVENKDYSQKDYLYTKASSLYFDQKPDEAKELFKQMLDGCIDEEITFKALLGLGNIAYNQNEKKKSFDYLKELKKLVNGKDLDLLLSYKLFEGTVLLYNQINMTRAREVFEETLQIALSANWTFFSQRAMYNLAKWHRMNGQKEQAVGMLKLLDIHLRTSDSRFLAFLVNNEFESLSFKTSQNLKIDKIKMEIAIGFEDKYLLELSRWPLLFKFMELLTNIKGFVSKDRVADSLWPNQKYLPKTHDPRIYDIVSRLKKKIELFEERPLLIESGPNGYKVNIS
jgi:tetratricopeptide (TPR) repeat protein